MFDYFFGWIVYYLCYVFVDVDEVVLDVDFLVVVVVGIDY